MSNTTDGLGLLVARLTACADDPMWADHAEVPKALLQKAAHALEETAALAGHYMAQRDEERAESARLRHLLNLARDDYNTAAQRLQDIGDYAHDHSTGPAVPDALWEVRSMAYGSGA